MRFAVFAFGSTHDALAAERALKEEDMPVRTVPTPHSLGRLCGIALRLPASDAERTRRVLGEAGLRVAASVEIDDV